MSTLGVVIPTKNSRTLLPRHLQSLNQWIEVVDEVVVVDSLSTDGTLEFLRENLTHPKLRLMSHPPGLYPSWNHGIRQLRADYTYLSTVGDTITREGLLHLANVAEDYGADVVLSKPDFEFEDGRPAPEPAWPLDEMLRQHSSTAPVRLRPLEMVIYAAAHPGGGLLGSSASNLYRTPCLQQHPFPNDYGAAGDGVWAVQHAGELVWSVTPERCSTFLLHAKSHAPGEKPLRLDLILQAALARAVQQGMVTASQLEAAHIPELLEIASRWLQAKTAFDRDRQRNWPWSLNPAAWWRRQQRSRWRRDLVRAQQRALESLRSAN